MPPLQIRLEPYGGQHFATFPPDLPRICIQASTSEAGVCASCGSQWSRVVEQQVNLQSGNRNNGRDKGLNELDNRGDYPRASLDTRTLSWRPTCRCNAAAVPATVLDPFAGTGTTLLAAMRLARRSVGTDLSEDYLQQAIKRLSKQPLPML